MKMANPPDNGQQFPNEGNGSETDSSRVVSSLRQYLRQYTYVDRSAGDWFSRLLYTLPIKGMLDGCDGRNNRERTPLLSAHPF
jgi:hypothetical protein